MVSIMLFYCYKKVFILTSICIIGKKFNQTPLLEKEYFDSQLNVKDISYADYVLAKRAQILIYQIYWNIMICMFKAIHYC